MLESVAETEGENCLCDGAEVRDCLLPTEDDIEKSFRVNQDGSMTVEMKVRLTLKEEETIHWTTTLTRSSVANQLNEGCLSEPEAEQEVCSPQPNSVALQSHAASTDFISKDQTRDNNDEDPPSLSNGVLCESGDEESNLKAQTDAGSPRRAPTPGNKQIRRKQTSVESMKTVTADRIQEGMAGSYSCTEHIDNGVMTEQYCMIKQSSTRPVPKPRRLGSLDANNTGSRNMSMFKSAEMTQLLQLGSSGEEITETVLHVYEQQTCQDNFLANISAQDMSASGISVSRPATSEIAYLSSKNEFEPVPWRPLTASESISNRGAESMSIASKLTLPSLQGGEIQGTNSKQQFPESTRGKDKHPKRVVNRNKRVLSKPKVVNKRFWKVTSSGKGQKGKDTKVKTFSSAGFIQRIYGNKSKSAKSITKLKKRSIQKRDGGVKTKSSQPSDDTITRVLKDRNIPSPLKGNAIEAGSFEPGRTSAASNEPGQPKGILSRQTSVHQDNRSENMYLPGFNSSSSVSYDYVEKWLEKAHPNPTSYPHKEPFSSVQTENTLRQFQLNGSLDTGAGKVNCLQSDPVTEGVLGTPLKQRIQSFENKSSSLLEKTTVTQQEASSDSLTQNNSEEVTAILNGIFSVENPFTISLEQETLSCTLSMDMPLPPPPPPAENTELLTEEYCVMDVPPALSSPLYRLSSASSQTADYLPLSISPTSSNHAMKITASLQTDIHSTLGEEPLPRTPSIKRAPLVSNQSLERKMSLRKACLDKYTSCSDAISETTTSSTPSDTLCDVVLPNGICSAGTQQPGKSLETQISVSDLLSNSLCCSSASPVSSASDERISSDSILSSGAPTPSNLLFKETEMPLATQKEVSPKKVKLISSQSPARKPQTKKLPSDLSYSSTKLLLHDQPPHKTTLPNTGLQKPSFSPSMEKKQIHKPKLQKKLSPYSQSLDMVSPPVRHKTVKKMLSRNLSSDNVLEPANRTQRKMSPQRKSNQTSKTDLDKTLTCHTATMEMSQSDEKKTKTADFTNTDQEKSWTDTQTMPQPLNTNNQPNIKPVLDKICYSIKSIRQITQSKRPSCLEKSNSLPDFSSHVASTFGSSSKVLLAFLSVMTLKECITNLSVDELNANNVSCAEALKMIDSLREIASIEDSQKLKGSLSDLQQSASKQLLQSWKGFQELGDKRKSRSSTPNYSEVDLENDCGIAENVINELMDNLDIPEKLKEELASLTVGANSESEAEKKMPLNRNSDADSREETVTINNGSQDEAANVDVRSIIKKFRDINQPQQSNMNSVSVVTETAKDKPADRASKGEDGHNVVARGAAAGPKDKQTPGDRQPYSKDRGANEENLNEDGSHVSGELSGSRNLEKLIVRFETEGRQLQMHSEVGVGTPVKKLSCDCESGSDEEGLKESSTKVLNEQESCEESVSSSDKGGQHSSEEDHLEVNREEVKQESSELSNHESHSQEEDAEEPSSNYYVEMNFSKKESIVSLVSNSLSNPESPFNPENEQEVCKSCMGLTVSVDESTANSDVDEASPSEEEQPEVECKELKVITEEGVSGPEEEEHLHNQLTNEEETEQDQVSLADRTSHTVGGELSIFILNQDFYTKSDNSLTKCYRFNTDEDSGNDHSSCEEQAEVEGSRVNNEQFGSSIEEELNYNKKESISEGEHVNTGRNPEENCKEATQWALESEVTDRPQCEGVSQSVAERVSLLEKQVADAQNRKNVTKKSAARQFSQRNAHVESDVEDSPSESPTSQSALCTRSAPQSSLSFSYDSSGVITTEPEGSRVRSIRQMFLAKSVTDVQHRNRGFPSPNVSEPSELRAQTSASGGYQTQTSSDISSGEDDSARKSITKGFVRRTIERLYGKKDANPDEEASERPPSATKQKKKEHSSIFSPFHAARSKAMSELSYFNSTNALDTLSEARRCIAFNAQVEPGDSVPIDNGRWLLKENTQIRKSASDPAGINKTFTNCPHGEGLCEDTQENTPYSLFSTKPEEEEQKSLSRKCTYFSLPHANDSEACQDEQSITSKSQVNGESVTDTKETGRGTTSPAAGVTDFKMTDNKVHPLVEVPPDGEVVVVQPGKGQGVMNRRLQEPDMLDLLYNFCGQHCPIL